MDYNTTDLASGTFVEKWPTWLRWLLFLPSAVIFPILFYAFQYLMQTWFLDIGPNAFFWVLSRSIIYGAGFVLVGAAIAPKHQEKIALGLMTIIAMLVGLGLYSAFLIDAPLSHYLEALIMLISSGVATYYIFKEK